MVECTRRESPSWQPNVQETRRSALDPQRQHAQLLTVWAQGNKAFRRWQHYEPQGSAPWAQFEPWWNLARKLEERGLVARVFPAPQPVVLVSGLGRHQDAWCAVVADANPWRDIFRHIVVIHPGPEALAWDSERFSVSMACAARLGRTHWEVLAHEEESPPGSVHRKWEPIGVAIDILSLLSAKPRLLRPRGLEDLEALAQLFRHRGHAQNVVLQQPTRYPWVKALTTRDGQRYEWPVAHGQDEDIVH